jgi:hypothetical protein
MMRTAYVLERQMAGQEWGWMKRLDAFMEKQTLDSPESRVMELAAENERLQRIVAELLIRNQELRERVEG